MQRLRRSCRQESLMELPTLFQTSGKTPARMHFRTTTKENPILYPPGIDSASLLPLMTDQVAIDSCPQCLIHLPVTRRRSDGDHPFILIST